MESGRQENSPSHSALTYFYLRTKREEEEGALLARRESLPLLLLQQQAVGGGGAAAAGGGVAAVARRWWRRCDETEEFWRQQQRERRSCKREISGDNSCPCCCRCHWRRPLLLRECHSYLWRYPHEIARTLQVGRGESGVFRRAKTSSFELKTMRPLHLPTVHTREGAELVQLDPPQV